VREIRGRILVGRYHLDGHDRGILSVIAALRDAGIEVIYMLFSHPDEIVQAALEEDPDVIGLSSSLGQHELFVSLLIKGLNKESLDIPVILGGIVPTADVPKLLRIGVKQVFGPGSTPGSAVTLVKALVAERYNQVPA
jgi:methylmalonyl-CoA mutase C-terminal domain/subunit